MTTDRRIRLTCYTMLVTSFEFLGSLGFQLIERATLLAALFAGVERLPAVHRLVGRRRAGSDGAVQVAAALFLVVGLVLFLLLFLEPLLYLHSAGITKRLLQVIIH